MKEIVNKLHGSRQIELAKSVLESNGYTVSKKIEEAETTKSIDVVTLKKLVRAIGDFGSDFPRSLEGLARSLLNEKYVDISVYYIKDAKEWLAKYSDLYNQVAELMKDIEAGTYSTSKGTEVHGPGISSKSNQ